MNDFGFDPFQLLYKNGIFLLENNSGDIYNPNSPHLGNTNLIGLTCLEFENKKVLVDWLYAQQSTTDLRMSAVTC